MALGWTIFVVAVLAIAVVVLNRKARGSNYARFRGHHSRRKYRVPLSEIEPQQTEEKETP